MTVTISLHTQNSLSLPQTPAEKTIIIANNFIFFHKTTAHVSYT